MVMPNNDGVGTAMSLATSKPYDKLLADRKLRQQQTDHAGSQLGNQQFTMNQHNVARFSHQKASNNLIQQYERNVPTTQLLQQSHHNTNHTNDRFNLVNNRRQTANNTKLNSLQISTAASAATTLNKPNNPNKSSGIVQHFSLNADLYKQGLSSQMQAFEVGKGSQSTKAFSGAFQNRSR